MSILLSKIRDRVQGHIRDVDNRRSTFQPQELDLAICDAYLALESRLPQTTFTSVSGLTIAGGGETFSLPTTVSQYGSAELAGDVRIQRVQNGQFLIRITTEEIDRMRNFYTPNTYLAIPYYFALWREKDETIQGRCWPGASIANVCNLFITLTADDMRDYVGAGTGNLDTVSANLSRIGATALVYHTAALLLAQMTSDDAALRKIDKAIAPVWFKEAAKMLYEEAGRRSDLEEVGRTQRWVG